MAGVHKLEWEQRDFGLITGVEDVVSFEGDRVILKTNMGTLTICGKDFQVKYFSVEKQEISLSGNPVSFKYSSSIHSKGKKTWSNLLK